MKFAASVDGPSLRLTDRVFSEPVTILAQPTYGRFLFRSHDLEIYHCVFTAAGIALDLGDIFGGRVRYCAFIPDINHVANL